MSVEKKRVRTPAELARAYLAKRNTTEVVNADTLDLTIPSEIPDATTEISCMDVVESAPLPPAAPQDILAWVNGFAMADLPQDLYIPPDALEVVLDAFEGPLDLLLYLIRRQNLDILQISIAEVTRQYMEYMELMKSLRLELAAEYLVMAALLGEIKSRSLLPRPKRDEGEEEDPRVQLIRRLQEYERCKQGAEILEQLPQQGRDFFVVSVDRPDYREPLMQPDVSLKELLFALKDVLARADLFESHHVQREKLSTRERMSAVLARLQQGEFIPFVMLFKVEEGRLGVVVTFLALLELIKESLIELVQSEPFAPIHVRVRVKAIDVEDETAFAEDDVLDQTDVFAQDDE